MDREHSGRFLFNPMALQILGINPTEARQRGYPIKEQSALGDVVFIMLSRTKRQIFSSARFETPQDLSDEIRILLVQVNATHEEE
jgi:hypothetical protein